LLFDGELSSIVRETIPPELTSVNPPAGVITNLPQITVTFSEPVKGVASDDLLLNGVPALGVTGSGAVYAFSFAQPAYGNIQVSWDPGHGITDLATPPNAFSSSAPSANWSYTFLDVVPPLVANLNPPAGAVMRHVTQLEVVFSESVVGVQAEDLLVNGFPATNLVTTSASKYLFQFAEPATGTVQFAWAPGHAMADLSGTNAFAGGTWSAVLDPNAVLGDIIINEILAHAVNTNGYKDEDREVQGWIELYNQGTTAANLNGWSLTDNREAPDRWIIPDLTLQPGQYYLIFASGKDRTNLAGGQRLHANFKLNPFGDYLGLFNNESPRRAVSELYPKYAEQRNPGPVALLCDPDPGGGERFQQHRRTC
jgi:hypothetical protein